MEKFEVNKELMDKGLEETLKDSLNAAISLDNETSDNISDISVRASIKMKMWDARENYNHVSTICRLYIDTRSYDKIYEEIMGRLAEKIRPLSLPVGGSR